MSTDFNLQEMLTTTEFTIPITLEEKKPGTLAKKHTVQITYQFSDEIGEALKPKKELDETEKEITKAVPLNEQLAMLVQKIDGVDSDSTVEFWSRVAMKYKTAILQGILRDIYPNVKTSGA